MKRLIITILASALCGLSYSQTDSTEVEDWKLYKGGNSDVDTVKSGGTLEVKQSVFKAKHDTSDFFTPASSLDYSSGKKGTVTVNKDGRINELFEFMGSENAAGEVKIDGFRVQVFFDQDRDKVLSEKARFLNSTSKIPAYMEWDAPNHYVRVGDYYTRQQALELIEELDGAFPSATIISCKINLPELDQE